MLSNEFDLNALMSVLTEQALDITHSDLACLSFYTDSDGHAKNLSILYTEQGPMFLAPEKIPLRFPMNRLQRLLF
jgi:hypothetical protein